MLQLNEQYYEWQKEYLLIHPIFNKILLLQNGHNLFHSDPKSIYYNCKICYGQTNSHELTN